MELRQAESYLEGFIRDLVLPLGFENIESLVYERSSSDAIAMLLFPCRIDAFENASFNIHVGGRFDELSEWLVEDAGENPPTFAQPIHFLREDQKYIEWKFKNTVELERLRCDIIQNIEEYAFPFIERFSTLPRLKRVLESEDKQDWFDAGLNIDQRVIVLAAIYMNDGEKNDAVKLLDDALAERNNQKPVRWIKIKRLRRRILESGNII